MKYMLFCGILVILFLAISVIIFFIVYQKRLLAQQIRLQSVQHEYQRELLTSSIAAQEKERVRIGHDLHDEIGSSLSTAKLLVNQLNHTDPEKEQLVNSVKEILSHTIQNLKNISLNLYPSVLTKFGLVEGLQYLVSVLSQASPLTFTFDADEISGLELQQELALYRIVQELVNNAIKHSGASDVHLELRQTARFIQLSVRDNGCGFDPREAGKGGIGLKSIEARKEMLKAEMQIQSVPGEGTCIIVRLPVL
ncbi:sensor histidine kinase [Chitinophaga sancti]|nr:sensor histidine kinase [Chitinophaga sancti]WQD59851.1 sensor histidine kinase [Chitinophaga sancti]WQG88018.1 sensor histidine kinase [Chitinophaga sancti]